MWSIDDSRTVSFRWKEKYLKPVVEDTHRVSISGALESILTELDGIGEYT